MTGPLNKVNYDDLAATYNRRFENGKRTGTAEALIELALGIQAQQVLEVGCGTGHWLQELQAALPSDCGLFGLDLSSGMLAQAQQQAELLLTRGRAEALPFPPSRFDLVYSINALHHFSDKAAYIREARRLLKPDGVFALAGMDPRRSANQWFVYHYFEGTLQTDLERFPSWGTVLDWMMEAGFEHFNHRTVEVIKTDLWGQAVLSDPFLEKSSCSQLALLSQAEYETGLARIRLALEEAEGHGETLQFEDTIYLDMLTGWA